jgi:HD-like signal output (HDOD) protein
MDAFMSVGRTHRAQICFPIHFTAPDRSRTHIGHTIDLSSTGFSMEVKSDEPLPSIILAGILPTQVAGDAILCKARMVWQGGLTHGLGRASYKIISIAQKSQERLDQLVQRSIEELIEQLRALPLLEGCDPGDLEMLLSLARVRELRADLRFNTEDDETRRGVYILLEGTVSTGMDLDPAEILGPGSVVGCWTEPACAGADAGVTTCSAVRALHLPLALVAELQNRAPQLASLLEEALGKRAEPPTRAPIAQRTHRMRVDMPRELQEIPTLPTVFNAVMDCVENPESTPRDLAEVLRQDQALTAKLLKTVNSALYGFSRRITSVNESVVLLGMQETANLAITAMLLNTLVDETRPESRPEPFWEHALGTAYFAHAIGQLLKRREGAGAYRATLALQAGRAAQTSEMPAATGLLEVEPSSPVAPAPRESVPPEIMASTARIHRSTSQRERSINLDRLFTYAILHDIGLVVLFLKFPDHYAMVRDSIRGDCDLHRAELELLEIDHCQLGYRVARAWRLPEPIPTIIAEHHLPQIWAAEMRDRDRLLTVLREDPTVTIVSLADLMARRCCIGVKLDHTPPEIPAPLGEVLGLEPRDIDELLAQGASYKARAEDFFRGTGQ